MVYRQALATPLLRRVQGACTSSTGRTSSRRWKRARHARGRLRRRRGHRSEARLTLDGEFAGVVLVIAIALGVRLRQRVPRRRQLDRNRRVHARALTPSGRRRGPRSSTSSPSWSSAPRSPPPSPRVSSMPDVLSIGVVFAGLIGAIVWNLITFYLGLPTSSSHALVGGIAGAAVAKGGLRRADRVGTAQDRRVHRAVATDRPGPRHAAA